MANSCNICQIRAARTHTSCRVIPRSKYRASSLCKESMSVLVSCAILNSNRVITFPSNSAWIGHHRLHILCLSLCGGSMLADQQWNCQLAYGKMRSLAYHGLKASFALIALPADMTPLSQTVKKGTCPAGCLGGGTHAWWPGLMWPLLIYLAGRSWRSCFLEIRCSSLFRCWCRGCAGCCERAISKFVSSLSRPGTPVYRKLKSLAGS